MDIALIKNNAIEFSRNLSWAKPIIQDIQSDNIIEPTQLEIISTEITKALINELQQALSSCRNIEDNELVGHIFLTGGGVLAPHNAQHLEKETEVSNLPRNLGIFFLLTDFLIIIWVLSRWVFHLLNKKKSAHNLPEGPDK